MSRSTFRDRCDGVAWQKLLRDRYVDEGVPPVPHLDVGRAEVRRVSRESAKQIILRYEWLGTLPPGTTEHFGLFFGLFCAGVTAVGLASGGGANLHAWKPFGLASDEELATLVRGACVHWAPVGANSKLVSWTCRLLARETAARLIIAYADTDAGEIGTIYQACNWTCVGRGESMPLWIHEETGRTRNMKCSYDLARTKGGTEAEWAERMIAAGWRRGKTNPKFRYVQVLRRSDRELRRRVAAMAVPYPKRGEPREA